MTFDNAQKSPTQKVVSGFLRFFFHLLYHQMAWSYDWVAAVVSLGRWKKWIHALLPYLEGSQTLELGHGPGHLLAKLYQSGVPAVGLDESGWMSGMAYRRLRVLGFDPLLVNGYAQSLPFNNESFRQVVATFPSEYMAHPDTLDEIHRILQIDGTLWILPVAWISGNKLPLRTAAWLFRVTGQSPHKEHFLNDERITDLFENAGLVPEFIEKEFEDSTVLIIKACKMKGPVA